MNDHAQHWMNCADYDIESAKVMLNGKRYLYVGFLCHLTIEKALKAYLIREDEEAVPPKIHNLIKLAALSGIDAKLNDEQNKLLDFLTPLEVEGCYPSYKSDIAVSLNAASHVLSCWRRQRICCVGLNTTLETV